MSAKNTILLNLELQEIKALISEFKKTDAAEADQNEIFAELELLVEENKDSAPTLRFSNSYSHADVSMISQVMKNSNDEELKFYLQEHLLKFEEDQKKSAR